MATQITVIGAMKSGNDSQYNCIFWLTPPANNIIAIPSFNSAVPSVDATTLAALRAGTIVEQSWGTGLLPATTTLATLKNLALTAYSAAQTALTATNPPLAIVGATYNGTTWSL